MMRFVWAAVASGLLVSGCGGGPSSPNFDENIVGIRFASSPTSVQLGGTTQLILQGLYSTPPGTDGGVPCAGSPSGFCVVGPAPTPSKVTWAASNNGTTPNLSVTQTGVVSGLRHGGDKVTATFQTLTATVPVAVSGEVLTAISVARTPAGTASVPLGRSVSYTATGTYSNYTCTYVKPDGSVSDTPICTTATGPSNGNAVSVTWSLSNPAIATLNPATGSDTVVQTIQRGTTAVRSSKVNVEGDTINGPAQSLTISAPVLDEILLSPDGQNLTVGTTQNYTVTGRFSNSSTFGDIPASAADIKWTSSNKVYADLDETTAGTSKVVTGKTPNADGTGPATPVSVTLTVRAFSPGTTTPITNEDGDDILDTALVSVVQADLIRVVQACPVSTTGTGAVDCPTAGADSFNLPASLSATTPESKREVKLLGLFTNDNVAKPINPAFIDWSTTPGSTIATVNANGVVAAGTAVGSVEVTGKIKDGLYPNATVRSDAITVNVTDRVCVLPFLSAQGASATGSPTNSVTNPGNAIDADPNSFATVSLTAGATPTTFRLTVNAGGSTTYNSVGRVGFVIERPTNGVFNPSDADADGDLQIQTYTGTQQRVGGDLRVDQLSGASATNRVRELLTVAPLSGTPNNFNRLDLTLTVPGYLTGGNPLDLLLGLLLGGDTYDFTVYSACAQANRP